MKRKLIIILKIDLYQILYWYNVLLIEVTLPQTGSGTMELIETGSRRKPFLPLIINGLVPVIAGGLIYVIWRDKSLVMFQWFDALHISGIVALLRNTAINLPNWVVYSVPAGLWAYSFNYSIFYIWHDADCKIKYIWMVLVPLAVVGLELGQLLGFISGTFDIVDIIYYLIFICLSFLAIEMTSGNQIKT